MDEIVYRAYMHKQHRRALRALKTIHHRGFKTRHRGLPRGRPSTSHIAQISQYYSHFNLPSGNDNPKLWLGKLVRKWFGDSNQVFRTWDMDVVNAAIQEASRDEFATYFVSITECKTKTGDTIVVRNTRKDIEEAFKGSKTGVMLMCTAFGGLEKEYANELEMICKNECTKARKLIAALRYCIGKNRRIRFDERLFDARSPYYCVALVNAMVSVQKGGLEKLKALSIKAPIER